VTLRIETKGQRIAREAKVRLALHVACFRLACSDTKQVARAGELAGKIWLGEPHGLSEDELKELQPFMTQEAGRA